MFTTGILPMAGISRSSKDIRTRIQQRLDLWCQGRYAELVDDTVKSYIVGDTETPSNAPLREAYPHTERPHRRPSRATLRRAHMVRNKIGSDPPSHTISLPSVPHHLIWRFGCHQLHSMVRYILLYKNVLTTLPVILITENLTWDRPGQVHIQRVNIPSPEIKKSPRTAQIDSAKYYNDQILPPLHPPVDGDRHSPSSNCPK